MDGVFVFIFLNSENAVKEWDVSNARKRRPDAGLGYLSYFVIIFLMPKLGEYHYMSFWHSYPPGIQISGINNS